jgi:hypothetical protein
MVTPIVMAVLVGAGFEWEILVKNHETGEVKAYRTHGEWSAKVDDMLCGFKPSPVDETGAWLTQVGSLYCVRSIGGQAMYMQATTAACVSAADRDLGHAASMMGGDGSLMVIFSAGDTKQTRGLKSRCIKPF